MSLESPGCVSFLARGWTAQSLRVLPEPTWAAITNYWVVQTMDIHFLRDVEAEV